MKIYITTQEDRTDKGLESMTKSALDDAESNLKRLRKIGTHHA
jgi:hypothetical protein